MESPAVPKRSNDDLADGDADGGNPMDYPPAKRQKHAYSPHAAEKIVPVSRQPKALKSVLKGAATMQCTNVSAFSGRAAFVADQPLITVGDSPYFRIL